MLYAIAASLMYLSWLQPLHFLPWVSWHSEVPAFLAVLLLVAVVIQRHWKHPLHPIRFPLAGLAVALMMVVVVCQTLTGLIPFLGDSLILLFYLSLCFMSIAVGFDAADWANPRIRFFSAWSALQYLAGCLLAIAVCSVLIGIVQSFDVWPSAGWIVRLHTLRRPGANFGQPNHLATFILMGLASLVYLFESVKLSKSFALSMLTLLVFGLALTESRSGILSLVLLTVWWFARRRSAGFITPPAVVIATGTGLFAFLFIWPPLFTYIQEGGWSAAIVSSQINVAGGTRLVIWPQLIAAVLRHPWLGWGLREVSTAHNAVLDSYIQGEPFTYAHNIILDLAVGMGLPLTFIAVGAALVWIGHRLQKSVTLIPWYCIALILPMTVHSMLEFPFAYAYFLAPVMFAVGFLERTVYPERIIKIPLRAALSGWIVIGLLMAWSMIEYIKIEEDFRIARFEALRVGNTPADYHRPKVYLLTQLDALLEGSRVVPSRNMSPERLELSRKVAMHFPWTAVQNRYALCLALNGQKTEAIRQLKVMRAMHGRKNFEGIAMHWNTLGDSKYPELKDIIKATGD
jgi:O-antigen ligase